LSIEIVKTVIRLHDIHDQEGFNVTSMGRHEAREKFRTAGKPSPPYLRLTRQPTAR